MPVSPHTVLTAGFATALAAGAAVLLAGCVAAPGRPTLPTELPPAWRSTPPPAEANLPAPDLQGWWKALGDPRLDALVDRALAGNLTIAQARSRRREAWRLAAAQGGRFRPNLEANVSTVQDAAAVDNYLHGSIDASWELGLFGRQEAVERGVRAGVDESVGTEQAARVSVVAEVVRLYVELRTAQAQAALLRQMVGIDDGLLALHAVRDKARLGDLDHRHAIQLRRAQAQAAEAAPRQAAAAAAQAIAVLLGQPSPEAAWSDAPTGAPLPMAPTAFRLEQVPADLLRFRPDVRRAEAAVDQATSELGLARAELYPRVTLGLAYVYAYNLTQNRRNVSSDLPAVGLGIDIPLFDSGRRRLVADARGDALDAAWLGYRQTLLDAFAETEAALSGHANARRRAEQVAEAERLVRGRLPVLAARERLGLGNAVDRLEGERAALQAQAERTDALAACTEAFVRVYKALGGAPLVEAGLPPPTFGAAAPEGRAP